MPDTDGSRLAVAEREIANLWTAFRAFANIPLDLGLARHDIDELKRNLEKLEDHLADWRREMAQRSEQLAKDQTARDELEQERDEARRRYEKEQKDAAIRFRVQASIAAFVALITLISVIIVTAGGA